MQESQFLERLSQEIVVRNPKNREEISKIRRKLLRELKPESFPSFAKILNYLPQDKVMLYKDMLSIKPNRIISGVFPVTVMIGSIGCLHGKCIFCPGGPNSFFGDTPQSYTGNEPASKRAKRNDYDPYLQTFNRLEQYGATNKTPNKIEIIINGGTFSSTSIYYQDQFAGYIYKALNDFSKTFILDGELNFEKFKEFFLLPGDIGDIKRSQMIKNKVLEIKGKLDLEYEKQRNQTADIKAVAFCVETKPDWSKQEQINQMLKMGVTRVELGVQCLDDDILTKTHRGHSLADSAQATQLLKDSFLKVGYHMMPGLPGSCRQKDILMFKELFDNDSYKPDALKIYPCMVMPGTGLYHMYKKGEFTPISTKQAADIIVESKKFIPEYCRVMRVQRDIPTNITEAGVDKTNLRQYVEILQKQREVKCRCIRCREPRSQNIDWDCVKICEKEYISSGSQEIFISADDTKNDILLGFLRLRIPYKPFRPEITSNSAGIRELHVYGQATAFDKQGEIQHRGLGKQLIAKAEKIAKEKYGIKKMLVISGVGVREYYKKLGYFLEGPYMVKFL